MRRPPLLRNALTVIGLIVLACFVLAAILAPTLSPHDPLATALAENLRPPSAGHPLGTDQLGRDLLSRILHGARLSLTVGLVVVSLAGIAGVVTGLAAGFWGGLLDDVLMRLTDVFLAFPSLILAMAIAAALGPSLFNVMVAIAAVTWPIYARLTRGQVLALRERPFIEAALAIGVPGSRLLWRHLLPNVISPLLVQASFDLGAAILAAAGLSFIGFGAQPPTPEWGVMISEGRNYIATQWWLSTFPALAILLVVTGFNLLGDGLRDLLDPHTRRGWE